MKSNADIEKLYSVFSKNRKAISFWLNKCIFPRDLQQYEESICSSAFDLSDTKNSLGFSGTIDNQWIIPHKIVCKPCGDENIKSTDGKMMHMITTETK